MAFIAPGTTVALYPDVPFTRDYENTMWFSQLVAQTGFFDSWAGRLSYTNQSYQRWETGRIQLNANADDLVAVNYMSFTNSAFTSKRYYAFVTGIEYVSNVVCIVNFEIDVIQTWMFDWELENCFIERQHTATDEPYEHTIPENLECGNQMWCNKIDYFSMNDLYIGMLATVTSTGDPTSGSSKNNYYSGLNVIAGVPVSDPSSINALIQNIVDDGDEDAIVTMYEYPSFMGTSAQWTGEDQITIEHDPRLGQHDYVPRNKKLLCYPYSQLIVSNNSGQTTEFHWEDFSYAIDNNVTFYIEGMHVPSPTALCFPLAHRGVGYDVDAGIVYDAFPQVSWAGDAFKAWQAQNANSQRMSVFNTVLNNAFTYAGVGASLTSFSGAGMAAGAAIGAGAGAIVGVGSMMAKNQDLKNTPPQAHGQLTNNSLNAARGRCQFTFYQMTIRDEYAKIIDAYFDMYGYKVNTVGTPDISSRPHWNYVKTIGCDIKGAIPQGDKEKICSVFDKGIRFWKNVSEIGNYSLDNSPTS